MAVLLYMCKNSMAACSAVSGMARMLGLKRVPTSQWFMGMIHGMDPGGIEAACQRFLRRTVRMAIRDRLMQGRGIVTAIDFCLKPYTGRTRDGNVVPGKPKGGTPRFEGYATLHAVGRPGLLTIAALRVAEGMARVDCVLSLLSELRRLGIAARVHLMDREFCTVDVMAAIEGRKELFLMDVSRNSRIAKAVAARMRGEIGKASEYAMRPDGGATFTFKLAIVRRMVTVKAKGRDARRWKCLTLATNMPTRMLNAELDGLLELYAKRWRIEDNYKPIECCRARTCSRNHAVRTFQGSYAYSNYTVITCTSL